MKNKNFGKATRSVTVLLFLLLTGSLVFGQQKVSGKVADINDKGIAGVVVSDGFNVTSSDSNGNFVIETNPSAKFVFVSTPDGYEQVSEFFIRLNEKLTENPIFRLKKVAAQPSNFIHIGDPEETIYKNYMDGLKDYIANHKLAFILFNGDICYEKGMNLHAREFTSEKMGLRVVYSLGNHDLVAGDYGEQLYEKLFGPVWYSFNIGGLHFVNLPVNYGDKVPSYSADDLYNWVRKDLDALPKGTPFVLITHHLYGYSDNFVMKTDKQNLDLNAYNFKGYLYAHYHTNTFHKSKNGASLFSSMSPNKGGIDHSPSSFRVISFDKQGNLSSEIKYSNLDNHIIANGFVEKNSDLLTVVANIYDTGSEVVSANVIIGSKEYLLQQKTSWSWILRLPKSAVEKKSDNTSVENLRVKVIFSDGSVVYKRIITDHNPKIKWINNLGGNIYMTAPLIAGDLVITATIDDNSGATAYIKAMDKNTGENKWCFKTRNSVRNNIALWEGTVLACDIQGWVYALDASTGALKWSHELRENVIQAVFGQGVAVDKGVVYAGNGINLKALRISDGKVLWVNSAWKGGGVSTTASPAVEPVSGILLAAGYWLGRFAHDVNTGKLVWEKRDDDTRNCDNPPAVFGGRFFYTSPNCITEVDALTGVEVVKQKVSYTLHTNSRPVITDKYFIVGTTDKGVVAYDRLNNDKLQTNEKQQNNAGDPKTYKELWNFKTNPALLYTAPYTKDFQMTVESGCCLVGDNLYFGANDGFLYCVDVRNGLYKWRLNLGSPILGDIVVEGGSLYVCDFGGNMWSISL